MTPWKTFHPESEAERAERDVLLGLALREDGAPFPIASEYPIVLGAAGTAFSYCVAGEDGRIVAHANLWPRELVTGEGVVTKVALVGNVATAERVRGRGVMTSLLSDLVRAAEAAGAKALLLWSDLEEFYQKQGFRSCGREYRLELSAKALPRGGGFSVRRGAGLPLAECERLLSLRPRVPATLRRSPAEFQAQLGIPATTLVVGDDAYAIIGKGCDMQGVAHEWGGPWEAALAACRAGCEALALEQLLVLSPQERKGAQLHPMCWARELAGITDGERDALTRGFVWGLDSI